MKKKYIFLALYVALAATFFAVVFAVVSKSFDRAFDRPFSGYGEPFPAELPAGYCLMTDGSRWTTRGVLYGQTWRHTMVWSDESPEAAVYWAWRMRESYRKDKYAAKPKDEALAELKTHWRPADPELCKEPAR